MLSEQFWEYNSQDIRLTTMAEKGMPYLLNLPSLVYLYQIDASGTYSLDRMRYRVSFWEYCPRHADPATAPTS